MLYVSKIFSSIQGEGCQTGLPSLFVRLAGCNKKCSFCDTAFEQKEIFFNSELATIISQRCEMEGLHNIIFTGGEPLLQMEHILNTIRECHNFGCIAKMCLETNGSIPMDQYERSAFHHISMSPKQSFIDTRLTECSSLKLLYPFQFAEDDFKLFYYNTLSDDIFLIPIEDPNAGRRENTEKAIDKVKELHKQGFDRVKLGVQLHKYLGLE